MMTEYRRNFFAVLVNVNFFFLKKKNPFNTSGNIIMKCGYYDVPSAEYKGRKVITYNFFQISSIIKETILFECQNDAFICDWRSMAI